MERRFALIVVAVTMAGSLSGCSTGGDKKPGVDRELSLVVDKGVHIAQPRLYDHSWDWLAKSFPGDRRQIEMADRKQGKIVASGVREIPIAYQESRLLRFRIRIDAKVGFYTIALDQPDVALEGRWYPVDGARRDVLEPQVRRLFQEVVADYQNYLAPFDKPPWDSGY